MKSSPSGSVYDFTENSVRLMDVARELTQRANALYREIMDLRAVAADILLLLACFGACVED